MNKQITTFQVKRLLKRVEKYPHQLTDEEKELFGRYLKANEELEKNKEIEREGQ